MAMKGSDIVLSYNDCLLRTEDVNLLKGPHWLNDIIIGFYFEYLDEKFNKPGRKQVTFVSPELTQLLKITNPIQCDMFLNPLNAKDSNFVFFPLNNWDRTDTAGGTHWSLLVYSKPEKTCYHFDSFGGFNNSVASEFAKNIITYFVKESNDKKFVEANCPQQNNGYDCGLYVLCLTDIICKHVLQYSKVDSCECSNAQNLVSTKREDLLNLINKLKSTPN